MKAKARTEKSEHQARAWHAWHTAVMPRMKEIPSLADLTGERPQIKKQTPAEAQSIFAAMREAASI